MHRVSVCASWEPQHQFAPSASDRSSPTSCPRGCFPVALSCYCMPAATKPRRAFLSPSTSVPQYLLSTFKVHRPSPMPGLHSSPALMLPSLLSLPLDVVRFLRLPLSHRAYLALNALERSYAIRCLPNTHDPLPSPSAASPLPSSSSLPLHRAPRKQQDSKHNRKNIITPLGHEGKLLRCLIEFHHRRRERTSPCCARVSSSSSRGFAAVGGSIRGAAAARAAINRVLVGRVRCTGGSESV